jgi:RNA polymerase sigma factor (sigma-70 family)
MAGKKSTSKDNTPIASKEEFEKLIIDNQNFAYSIVNKEFGKYSWDVRSDLNSAAIAGLVYAATKYDPAKKDECKFISYAVHWIRYYINEEIRKFYPVRLNQNFVSKRKKVMKFIDKYKEEHNGLEPDVDIIADNVDLSEKVVKGILNINGGENFQFVSFNIPVDVGDSNGNESFNESKLMKEYFENNTTCSPEVHLEVQDVLNFVKSKVPLKDYNIFYDYYVNNLTLSELKKEYNLPFASSVSYIIKRCEKICRELV